MLLLAVAYGHCSCVHYYNTGCICVYLTVLWQLGPIAVMKYDLTSHTDLCSSVLSCHRLSS